MTQKDIINAYVRIRTIDQTIPDDVLDFMKEASIQALNQSQPSEHKPPEPEANCPTAEDILKKHTMWSVESVIDAMQEHSLLQRREAIQECIPLIEKCEKTFGIINDILQSLQEAQPADLYLLVREIDIDLPLIQATIKDELQRLKK